MSSEKTSVRSGVMRGPLRSLVVGRYSFSNIDRVNCVNIDHELVSVVNLQDNVANATRRRLISGSMHYRTHDDGRAAIEAIKAL